MFPYNLLKLQSIVLPPGWLLGEYRRLKHPLSSFFFVGMPVGIPTLKRSLPYLTCLKRREIVVISIAAMINILYCLNGPYFLINTFWCITFLNLNLTKVIKTYLENHSSRD